MIERHREWSRREAKAYHTTFRHLSPHVSIHVAGLEHRPLRWGSTKGWISAVMLDSRDRSVGRVMDQSRHSTGGEEADH
jgi:hypothetical protein